MQASVRQLDERREHLPERSAPVLDLVVPALNEEGRIGATVAAILRDVDRSAWPMEVRLLVVDNGSVDATAEVVDLASGTGRPIEVISCQTRGKGAAVRAGVTWSTAPYVGYCDADLSTPPASIGQGIHLLAAGWDVVVGSRRCVGASYVVPQTALRRAGSAAFRAAAHRLVPAATDTQCGFKLFRADVAKALFAAAELDGFAFDVEVLARARRHADVSMIELPVQWTDADGSSFRPISDGIRSFRELRDVQRALRAPAAVGF
jgi:dolichyl-phosphate beta-glucosyltransferase